jgi:hypothetical protein
VAVALRLAGRALGPRDARRHRASGKLGTDSFECARPRQPAGFRPVNPTAGGNWQCIRGSAASAPPRLAASRYGEYCTLAASRAVVVLYTYKYTYERETVRLPAATAGGKAACLSSPPRRTSPRAPQAECSAAERAAGRATAMPCARARASMLCASDAGHHRLGSHLTTHTASTSNPATLASLACLI